MPGPLTTLTTPPTAPGDFAVARALALWREGIIDPSRTDQTPRAMRSREVISACAHEGLGWSSWTKKGRTLSEYRGDGDLEWCGGFAAYCWLAAGLRSAVRRHFASCYKLWTWSDGNDRRIGLDQVRAGSVVVVGDGDPWWGDHIVLAEAPIGEAGLQDVEGNGHAHDADGHLLGARTEGIVRNLRPVRRHGYRILFAVHPLPQDLEP